jgi:hypothetical protein
MQKEIVAALASALVLAAGPALASHPLISEDVDTLGKGGWQLQLHGERARDRDSGVTIRTTEAELELAYGVQDNADIEVGLPHVRAVTDGDVAEGRGDLTLAYKWRFYDAGPIKLLLKPALSFPTGRDELGLGAGRTSWGVDFAGQYDLSERLALLGNLRHERNRNRIGEREPIWHASAALLFEATESLKLALNVAQETNRDPGARSPIREGVVGAIYEASKLLELGLGLKKGLNTPADDRAVLFAVRLRY